jgi:hypothetical protein
MPNFRRFLSRRWLLAFVSVAALVFGLLMLHPYPRQSLFGPTIRGKPWCVWENAIRRPGAWGDNDKTLTATLFRWIGVKHEPMELRMLLNHPEMLPLVLELAEDQDREMRSAMLWTLPSCDQLRDPSVLPVLRRRLQDEDSYCRVLAARALWHVAKNKEGFAVAQRELEDSRDGNAHREASWLLTDASASSPELFPFFAAHAKHPDPGLRREAMTALSRFGKKSLTILCQGLEDADLEVRYCAVAALEYLGPDAKDAVPALARRLNDTEALVRSRTVEALKKIGPQGFEHLKAEPKMK